MLSSRVLHIAQLQLQVFLPQPEASGDHWLRCLSCLSVSAEWPKPVTFFSAFLAPPSCANLDTINNTATSHPSNFGFFEHAPAFNDLLRPSTWARASSMASVCSWLASHGIGIACWCHLWLQWPRRPVLMTAAGPVVARQQKDNKLSLLLSS